MNDKLSDEQWQQIEQALFAGRKIEAIKHFRKITNAGLKDAKELIDQHEHDLREQFPGRFSQAPSRAGCLVLLAVGLTTTIPATGLVIFLSQ